MKVRRRGDNYEVVDKGEVLSTHDSRKGAHRRMTSMKSNRSDSVRRFDIMGSVVDETHADQRPGAMVAIETDEGFLRFDARLTRIGVFEYGDAQGNTWGELRTEDEVFSEAAVDSFKMSTVTDDHPEEFVSVVNADGLRIGYVGTDVRRDGDFLVATIQITDADAITAIRAGKVELSCGYNAVVKKDVGVRDGIPHAGRQTGIRGNHVALVDLGRAGPMCRLLTQRGDALHIPTPTQGTHMFKVKFKDADGKDHTIEVADEAEAKAMQGRFDAMAAASTQLTTDHDKLKADADKLKADADKLKAKAKNDIFPPKKKSEEEDEEKGDVASQLAAMQAKFDLLEASSSPASISARVDARSKLVADTIIVLGDKQATDGVDDATLMRAICDEVDPTSGARIDARKDSPGEAAYLQATYEGAMVQHGRTDAVSQENARTLFGAVHTDGKKGRWDSVLTQQAKFYGDATPSDGKAVN